MPTKVEDRKVSEHPAARKMKLRRAGVSEGSEISEQTAAELDAAPEGATKVQLYAILQGKRTAQQVKVKYPADVRAAYKAALELTGTPDSGGPKYALTVRQTNTIKRSLAAKGKSVSEPNKLIEQVSDAHLRKIAKGKKDVPSIAVNAVRRFLAVHPALRDDRTMYARKGAAIILALREG